MFKFQWPFNLRWLFDISKNRRKKKDLHQLNSSFTKKMFVCILTFYILCTFREDVTWLLFIIQKQLGVFIFDIGYVSGTILIITVELFSLKNIFLKNLLRSGLYDVNVFAPNRFLNFYNGFTISFLKCTTSTQSNIQMSEKKFHHMYFCKNVKKNDIKYFKIMLTWL